MIRLAMTEVDVAAGLKSVLERIAAASLKRPEELQYAKPRLVAVSKTKPKELIIAAYKEGQQHFGENYIQELVDKSNDELVLEECKDIKWHYIGHLQTNKSKKLAQVKNLFAWETVDSQKIASSVNRIWETTHQGEKVNVMVQVNTSGEEGKSGVKPDEASELVKFINDNCPNLNVIGLMTIGQFGYDISQGPNPDFLCLVKCRQDVCKDLDIPIEKMEVSMGMSDDFEHAIELGSTNVRVGSSIFGARVKKQPAGGNTEGSPPNPAT